MWISNLKENLTNDALIRIWDLDMTQYKHMDTVNPKSLGHKYIVKYDNAKMIHVLENVKVIIHHMNL